VNKLKMYKWLPGCLIFLSLFLMIRQFVTYEVTLPKFILLGTLSYMAAVVVIYFRKLFTKIFVILLLSMVLIYSVDFVLETVSNIGNQEVMMEDGVDSASSVEGVGRRHGVDFIHNIRDSVDLKKSIPYFKWIVNDKVTDQWINGLEIETNKDYEDLFAVMNALLLTLLIQPIFTAKWLKPLMVAPLIFFVWMWYRYVDFQWPIYLLYFAGVFAFLILDRHEGFKQKHALHNQANYSSRGVFFWGIILSAVLIVFTNLAFVIIPFKSINTLVDAVIPNIWGARTGYSTDNLRIYSLRETPYQNDPQILGGPVGPLNSEDALFYVDIDQEVNGPIYLKTNIKDYYDGKRWSNPTQLFSNSFRDYLSNERNLEMLDSGNFQKISGEIRLEALKTVTLFAPMGFYDTDLDYERVYVSSENEAFYKSGMFVRFLRNYKFSATQKDFNYPDDADYLQLSDQIEERTYDLALRLGELGETDYEKVVTLTKFLVQNYDYNLSVPTLRYNQEFVSTFLFETQSGYCTYFASSLAVMTRINDIPSRYVEGFRVDVKAFDTRDGVAKVTEADAHAWTEVYFEDLGWVIFESTPPYSVALGDEYTPTVEEIVDEDPEEDELSTTNNVTDPNINLDDFLLERNGGRGEFFEDFTPASGEVQNGRLKVIWIIGVMALLLVVIILLRKPFMFLKRRNTHAFAVRIIYVLALMIEQTHPHAETDLGALFIGAGLPQREIDDWMRILYDRKENVTEALIIRSIEAAEKHLKPEIQYFKQRKGRMKYWHMRTIKIVRLID